MKRLLCLLEDRLEQNNENRKGVQEKLESIHVKILEEADDLEEKLSDKISKAIEKEEEGTFNLIEGLGSVNDKKALYDLMKKALEELSAVRKYEIKHVESADSFVDSYEFSPVTSVTEAKKESIPDAMTKVESIVKQLQEHMEKLRDSVPTVQDELARICNARRKEADELTKRINEKLKELFTKEDARLQELMNIARESNNEGNADESAKVIQDIKKALIINEKYVLNEPSKGYALDEYDIAVTKETSLEFLYFEERTPKFSLSFTSKGNLSLSMELLNESEISLLEPFALSETTTINVWEKCLDVSGASTFSKKFPLHSLVNLFNISPLTANTTYCLRAKVESSGASTKWSEIAEFNTQEFSNCCLWKECSDNAGKDTRYVVDDENPRIATMICDGSSDSCMIMGNTYVPANAVTVWNIKMLKLTYNGGECVFIGVAPPDIDPCDPNMKCEWYFEAYSSTLYSGPPHDYNRKKYGPRKGNVQYVRTGAMVGVVMDTTKGELSFVLDGVNLGVAYEGIPLDKPLVPCVILGHKGDSIELKFN